MTDLDYLQLAHDLAAKGVAQVSPNPLVGSVIVNNGQIVGRGCHLYAELKHAEVWALEEAGELARGATVYVNLEPCCHRGALKRTPPCVQALVEARVSRVVASMLDPNPCVDGRGVAELREAGIEVVVGLLEKEARRLNEKYIKYVTTGLPFLHLKIASSLDGRIATRSGDARWVTGEEARAASQSLRHAYDAILVGVNTVIADDPLLSDRTGLARHRPLVRVVLDTNLRIPLESQLVSTARELPLVVFSSPAAEASRREALIARGVEVMTAPLTEDGRLDLSDVLSALGGMRVTSLIVEGGGEVAASIVEQRLADKITFFYAPKIIGGRAAISSIGGRGSEKLSEALALEDVEIIRRGEDWEVTGYPLDKMAGKLD